HERDGRSAQGLRQLGAVPELLRDRRRRLAALPRREDRGREDRRGRRRSVLRRQDPDGDVLRAQRPLAVGLAAEAGRRGLCRRDGRQRRDVRRRAPHARDRLRHETMTTTTSPELVKTSDLGDGVRLFTLDNPPVNALGYATCGQLVPLLESAIADPQVTTIVFTGANGMFSGGADVNDFSTPPQGKKTIR